MRIMWALLFFELALLSQSEVPLITDRPDQTESAVTVPKKSLQIETGAVYEFDRIGSTEIRSLHFAKTLFRYGVTDCLELRLDTEHMSRKTKIGGIENTISGLGGLAIGAKVKLADESGPKPELALLVSGAMPVGNKAWVSEKMEPGFLVAASHTLSDKLGFGYNVGGQWADGKNSVWIYSAAFGMGLTDKLGGFVELYGNKHKETGAQLLFDAGVTYLLNPNLQLDASLGFAITEEAPDYFMNAGVTVRLPK